MASRFTAGDAVQTPFGKGVVREVRNSNRLLVDVRGRALVVAEADVATLDKAPGTSRRRPRSYTPSYTPSTQRAPAAQPKRQRSRSPIEVDLHGLTVEEALARAWQALNDALLAGLAELRFIHGRSGGRIRAALHQELRGIPSVRAFRVDPRNEGVTIVSL